MVLPSNMNLMVRSLLLIGLDKSGTIRSIQPRIVLTLDRDGVIEDVSPQTKIAVEDLLEKAEKGVTSLPVPPTYRRSLISEQGRSHPTSLYAARPMVRRKSSSYQNEHSPNIRREMITLPEAVNGMQPSASSALHSDRTMCKDNALNHHQEIEILMDSDQEFFHLLSSELETLDSLQAKEKESIVKNIEVLGQQVSVLVRPRNKGKHNPDLYIWRELFKLYTDAGIFQPASEFQRKMHDADKAAKQLIWFSSEAERLRIVTCSCIPAYN